MALDAIKKIKGAEAEADQMIKDATAKAKESVQLTKEEAEKNTMRF